MQDTGIHRLEAHSLTLHRGQRTLAVTQNLTVVSGDLVAVRGASGSGKTTLLRALAGLITADAGRVELDGHAPHVISWPTYRSRVTYVGQQPAFIDGTVRDNLSHPFGFQCRSGRYEDEAAAQLLELFLLEADMLDQPVSQLSVGEQQRIALIRALLTRPWFLLLDEPISALDAKSAKRVLKHLRQETKQKALGALVVSHDEGVLDPYATSSIEFPSKGR